MAAQRIQVCPPELVEAAESVATTTQRAAAPHPGMVPAAAPGSDADAACTAIAAGIASQFAAMATEIAGDGPRLLTTTEHGAAALESQDERNAHQLAAVPEQEQWL
jgi:hypothetical protein